MSTSTTPLNGWRVGVTADRRATQQVEVLRRRGAEVVTGCTMRTLDLSHDPRLLEASQALIDHPPNTTIIQTGMGLTMWLEAMDAVGVGSELRSSLAGAEILTRGPKATSAARKAGFEVEWSAPDEQLAQVVKYLASTGGRGRVALQIDGTDEETLVKPLAPLCKEVVVVPVYRWAWPLEVGPAEILIDAICSGSVDAVTFTTRQAAVHLVEIADYRGRRDELLAALDGVRVVPVSVGPVCSSAMTNLGMAGIVEPKRARMVAMVDALCAEANRRSTRR